VDGNWTKVSSRDNGFEHCIVNRSSESCERIFLSMYSGTAKVSSIFNTKDAHTTTISIDVIDDGRNDLTKASLQKAVERQMRKGFSDFIAPARNELRGYRCEDSERTKREVRHVIGIDLPCNTWTVCRSGGGGQSLYASWEDGCSGWMG
jgi:hypothetical protein